MINKVRSLGLSAKGFVYCLIGILTAMTAFDMGGKKTGKSGVINFLQKQPLGKIILIILSLGILAYALWRLYTAFADPKDEGNDASGIAQRIAYGFSGLIYLAFATGVFLSAFGSSGSGGGKKHYLTTLMEKSYGPVLIGIVGVIIICVGLYQIYRGYSKKYLEKLDYSEGHPPGFLKKTGMFGYIARGVIITITGYFYLAAAYIQNSDMLRGTRGAFAYLQQQSYGSILMGIIAIGLIAFGIFTLLLAKYSSVKSV